MNHSQLTSIDRVDRFAVAGPRRSILRAALLVLAPSALALATPAWATRYVSGTFGVDAFGGILGVNDCTTVPCATIPHAISQAGWGEAVEISDGPIAVCSLIVNKSITIRGGGAARLVLDGGNACRHFDVSTALPATVTLRNLELINGFATNGGSIRVGTQGDLSIRNARIADNEATLGGAIHNSGAVHLLGDTHFENNEAGYGGALYNVGGSLDANDAEFSWNEAAVSGGAIHGVTGTIEITKSSFGLNTARGNGGAIDTNATEVVITSTTFLWNTAEIGFGGAIANGEGSDLTLKESSVLWNLAGASGGGVSNSQGTATIVSTTLNLNHAQANGGAIANVDDGVLAVRDSTLSYNSAAVDGGAITDATGSATDTMIRRNTFLSNSARNGGAVHYVGAPGSELFVINSTYSENVADFGAAIFSTGAGRAAIANATLYGQELGVVGGGALFNDSSQQMGLNNSIITATTNAAGGGPGTDCFVPGFINGRHNRSDNCGAGGVFNLGPVTLLDPLLQDNGGETHTHALLVGSNAIDEGFNSCRNPETTLPIDFDQRMIARPQDGNFDGVSICDIGAYEFVPWAVVQSSVPNPNLP